MSSISAASRRASRISMILTGLRVIVSILGNKLILLVHAQLLMVLSAYKMNAFRSQMRQEFCNVENHDPTPCLQCFNFFIEKPCVLEFKKAHFNLHGCISEMLTLR